MTVYIITSSSGSYSDRCETNLGIVRSKEKAQSIVSLLEAASYYDATFSDERYKFERVWEDENKRPKFLEGKTKHQKERLSKEDHKRLTDEYVGASHEWTGKYMEMRARYMQENYKQPAECLEWLKRFELIVGNLSAIRFDYEEHEIID